MSDFLSREQELMKINEELDEKTQEVLKDENETASSSSQVSNLNSPKTGSPIPGDSRRSSLIVENDSSPTSSIRTSANIKNISTNRRDSKTQTNEIIQKSQYISSKPLTLKNNNSVRKESLAHLSPPNSRVTSPISPTSISATIKRQSITRRESLFQIIQTPPNSRTTSPKTAATKRNNFIQKSSLSQDSKSPRISQKAQKATVKEILSTKTDNKQLSSVAEEKSFGNKKTSQYSSSKAYTVPRYSRTAASKVSAKERELHNLNDKLDKKTKVAMDNIKENINKTTTKIKSSKEKSFSRVTPTTPRSIPKSPKGNYFSTQKRSPASSGKTSPPPLSKKEPLTLTETYKNKNFVESPSTEALSLQLSQDEPYSINSIQQSSLPIRPESSSTNKKESVISSSISKKSTKQPIPTIINKKSVTSDGLIKYLKSKLSVIEIELEDNIKELKKKTNEAHDYYEANKKLETQRNQLVAKNIALAEQLAKIEDKLAASEKKLKDRESELAATQCEMENAKRELRVVTQVNSNLEKKLYIANEELENMKNNFTSLKEMEREQKETTRREHENMEKQIKSLKKQRSELIGAYKKQLYLIDNLRRQNICMEQSRMVSFGEKEFAKVLAWDSHNFA